MTCSLTKTAQGTLDSADPERPEWMTLPAQLPEGWSRGDRTAGLRPASRADSPHRPPHQGSHSPQALQVREQSRQQVSAAPESQVVSLFSASQTLPRSLGEESHQKNINLLTWGPTASLSRIPKPQACTVSAGTLTAASGSLPSSVDPEPSSEAQGS